MNTQSLDQSILSTLAYAAVFSSGVSRKHFLAWLHTSTTTSKKVLFTRLDTLEKKRFLTRVEGIYVYDRKLGAHGKRNEATSLHKIQSMKDKLRFIAWVPWITGVGITGSVAAFNAKEDDDLDLILITQENRLWISRLFLSLFLWCLGYLRTHESHRVSNKLCLNVWLDESSLQFSQENIYIAREIVQILWIYDTNSTRERILNANQWIRSYFANTEMKKKPIQRKNGESPHIYRMITALNSLAFKLQVWYMGRHRSRETVELGRALFHPKDVNGSVLRTYKQIFSRYKKSYNGKNQDKRKK